MRMLRQIAANLAVKVFLTVFGARVTDQLWTWFLPPGMLP